MRLFVYAVWPIDTWEGWTHFDAMSHELYDKLTNRFAVAGPIAMKMGWQGDVMAGPFLVPVPIGEPECEHIIAWKQRRGGATFIVSPSRIDQMEDKNACFDRAEFEVE